ncbi:MAG: hypothetical protein Q7S13_06795, partial [Candidatus Omnitrophota bacterium]|nr:hypothetical protein [Candidatus Omnitrophota bacterium]
MSIIHEALKKVQTTMQNNGQKDPVGIEQPLPIPGITPPQAPAPAVAKSSIRPQERISLLLFLNLFGILLVGGTLYYILRPSSLPLKFSFPAVEPVTHQSQSAQETQHVALPSAPPVITPSVVSPAPLSVSPSPFPSTIPTLNGISMLGNKTVALINNQIYEVGESAQGKEVLAIYEDRVDLRDGENVLT